jgi:DNA-binding MarR family transcriptional regulator
VSRPLRRLPAPDSSAAGSRGAAGRELDLGTLQGIVGFHLARAAVNTHGMFERHVGVPFELTKVDFSLLMLLRANPTVSPKQLARALAITAPKLTLLLDRLQQRGMLQRRPNPTDGRSQLVVLTPSGRQLADRAGAAAQPMEDEVRARLSPAEHAMLIELLDKLARAAPRALP